MESETQKVDERLLKRNWCFRSTRRNLDFSNNVKQQLYSFGMIQNVIGDGNCGVYASIEGLLNNLIPVTTDVKLFRKQVYDYIDNNRDIVLPNFTFTGKKNRTTKMSG